MAETKLEKSGPVLFLVTILAIILSALWNVKTAQEDEKKMALEHAEEAPVQTAAASLFSLDTPSAESRKAGKDIYDISCATCHGANGDGKGPAGAALVPPARDFTQFAGYTYGISRESIMTTLEKGSPGTSMAPYSYLSEDEKIALTHYVRSFMPLDDAKAVAAANKIYGSSESVSAAPKGFDVTTAVFTDEKMMKATEARTVKSATASIKMPSSKLEKLKLIYEASLKRVTVSPFSTVIINSNDYDLEGTLANFNSFKNFVTSDAIFALTGESFQTLTNEELSDLYKELN